MATTASLSKLVATQEEIIRNGNFTKSDFSYHNTKQFLHNMWAKIYALETDDDRTALTNKILACLSNLDKKAEKNEEKKYQKYYSQSNEFSKRVPTKRKSISNSL